VVDDESKFKELLKLAPRTRFRIFHSEAEANCFAQSAYPSPKPPAPDEVSWKTYNSLSSKFLNVLFVDPILDEQRIFEYLATLSSSQLFVDFNNTTEHFQLLTFFFFTFH
jgi:hypothetical protein